MTQPCKLKAKVTLQGHGIMLQEIWLSFRLLSCEYRYPKSNAPLSLFTIKNFVLSQTDLNLNIASRIKPHVIQQNLTKLMLSNYDSILLAWVYCHKFLALNNQTLCYISMCICFMNIKCFIVYRTACVL